MKGKVFTVLCWLFYAALCYTAYNPNHEYLNVLDNTRFLYLLIHVPLLVIIMLFTVGAAFASKHMKQAVMEEKPKLLENKERLDKFLSEHKKLTEFNLFLFINRFIWYPTAFVTWAVLEDKFLGGVMLLSIGFSLILMGQLRKLSIALRKEIKDAIN